MDGSEALFVFVVCICCLCICIFEFISFCYQVVSYANEVRTGARLVDYDILASNGVIHAIDNVI